MTVIPQTLPKIFISSQYDARRNLTLWYPPMQSGSYACLLCCVVLLLSCFTIEVWAVVVVVARVSSICSLSEMPGHCQHIETAWHCGVAANTNPLTNTSGLEWKCVTDCMVNPRPHIHWLKPFFTVCDCSCNVAADCYFFFALLDMLLSFMFF